jgi:hypothetical protein
MPTVILAFFYGQSRIFLAMSRDGLLPPALARLSSRRNPVRITLFTAVVVALLAGLVPPNDLVALANAGTTLPGDFIHEALSNLLPSYRERRAKDLLRTAQQSPKPSPAPAMVGNWSGLIRTFNGDVPLSLYISESGDVKAHLGNEAPTSVSNVSFDKESLFGRISGKLPIEEDAGLDPYDLDFELYLRGSALNGSVTTRPHPGAKNFTRLPFWVEFKKSQPGKP